MHFFQLSIAPQEFNNSEEAMSIFPRACVMKLSAATGFIVALSVAGPAGAGSPKVGDPPEASNMRLVGFNDLQGRSAYQPTIHHQGNRWIAYIGHHGGTDDIPKPVNRKTGQPEFNGTSIIDVTDPAHPTYLRHLPGQEGTYESGGPRRTAGGNAQDLPKRDPHPRYLL